MVPESSSGGCKSPESLALGVTDGSTAEGFECDFFASDVVDVYCGLWIVESLEASSLHPTLG